MRFCTKIEKIQLSSHQNKLLYYLKLMYVDYCYQTFNININIKIINKIIENILVSYLELISRQIQQNNSLKLKIKSLSVTSTNIRWSVVHTFYYFFF